MAKKAKAKKKAARGAKKGEARPRYNFPDDAKIKVVGEHTRREGSSYFEGYEAMKKIGTVGAFRKKFGNGPANVFLRNAHNEKYATITGGGKAVKKADKAAA